MPRDIKPPRIHTEESPRQILKEDFRSVPELPIHGGWGYSQDDAVIIDKRDPIVEKGRPFDGVGIEYVFAEKRIYEELIIFREPSEKFSGIKWKLLRQSCNKQGSHVFDVLRFEVTAFPDSDWEELKAEWDGANGHGSPTFDEEAHERKRDAAMIRYVTEYWFEISSFYGA